MAITLKIRDLKKSFGSRRAVDGVSLEVEEGEIYGFLGPNGAGKTTTIKMIAGLISIDEGSIEICGHDVRKEFEKAMMNLGAIVENPEFYKYMSAYDNLKFFAGMYDNIGDDRIMEVADMVGLRSRINEKVKGYSLGMRQRLGVAQALLHKPKLLVFDEPTNGLDPAGIHALRDFFKGLTRETGVSIFVSSHILSEMQLMCDRVGIIQYGRILAVTDIKELNQITEEADNINIQTDRPAEAVEVLKEQGYTAKYEDNSLNVIANKDDISDITRLLVNSGFAIYGVKHSNENNLEKLFLKITGGVSSID